MKAEQKQAFIQEKASETQVQITSAKIYWSRHAITEAVKDDLTQDEVHLALLQAEVIEDYPTTHRPLPDCLVLGFLADERPLHAVIAIDSDNDRIFIVTVYLPSKEVWENDWQTRK